MSDVQRADPHARQVALLVVVCGAIMGVVLMTAYGAYRPALEGWVANDPDHVWISIVALTLLTSGPILGLAAYLWSLARRVVRSARFPPTGQRVVRDTPIVTGAAAIRRGRLLQAGAAAVGACGVLLAVALWRLAHVLSR